MHLLSDVLTIYLLWTNKPHPPTHPSQPDLVAEIEAAGFKSATYSNYTLGAVAVHSGFKFV